MKRLFLTVLCVIAIFIILACPEMVTNGVRQGIKLNLYSVIPALLPFMVLTNIMIKYNLCEYISYLFKPVLSKIFKVSSIGCFTVIIGFTCGYPMGAKVIGDLYRNRLLSLSEASYLITFCNNCSITFLLNYILFHCLGSDIPVNLVLIFVYVPPIMTGIINKFVLKPDISNKTERKYIPGNSNPILSAVKSMSSLSMYIICFTVISEWISSISFLPETVKYIIAGFTEITSGANLIATKMRNTSMRDFLILACSVFGGFSIMFQSFEQLPDKTLKKYYLIGKVEQLTIYCFSSLIIYCFL